MNIKTYTNRILIWIFFALIGVLFSFETKAQTRTQDSLALVDFYNSTDGPNWNNNSGWLTDPLDNWYGVDVQNGRVHGLVLPNNNIQTLPLSLPPLTELRFLNLSDNTISENIPTWLNGSSLPLLEILSLNQCYFTGDLPLSLSTLSALRNISINNPAFDDAPIPSWINGTTFPNLEVLSLRQANRIGNLSSYGFLGTLSNLISLELAGNNFDPGPTPVWMTGASFPFLEQLLIGGANINNLSNDFVTNLFEELRTLDISYNANPFIDNPLVKIADNPSNFPNLIEVYARNIGLDSLPLLTTLPAFTTLEARDNHLTFEDIAKNIGLSSFLYDPQERFGSLFQLAVCPDDIVVIPLDRRKALLPEYEVFRNGDTVSVGYFITNDTLVLNGPNKLANWTYRVFEKDLSFPDPSFRMNSNDHLIFPDNNCPLTPLQEDSVALVYFYQNADGPTWTNNSGWLTGPLHTWEGVVLDGGRVTELNLQSFGIEILGSDMRVLPELRRLVLSTNNFGARVPVEIPGWINDSIFPNLQDLLLSDCYFTGEIPTSLSSLNNLQFLDLGRNLFDTGEIPNWINSSSFPFLQFLNLESTGRNGLLEDQAHIATLSTLTSLLLGNNNFADEISPTWLNGSNFPDLVYLYLNDLSFKELSTDFLQNPFQNLAHLEISNNPFESNPLVAISQNPSSFPTLELIFANNTNLDTLPELLNILGISTLWVRENALRFDDIRRATNNQIIQSFAFDFQDSIGTRYVVSACSTQSFKIPLDNGDAIDPGYVIRLNGNVVSSPNLIGDTLVIPAGGFGTWTYTVSDLDPGFSYPSFILEGKPIVVFQAEYCIDEATSDTLRSPSNPYEAIISKTDGSTWEEIDSVLINVYGAVLKESCLCDGPRLYVLPDTLTDESGVYIGADAVRSRASTTVAAQSIDFFDRNYSMKNPVLPDTDNTVWDWEIAGLELDENKVKVMIIDWGVERNHPYLKDYFTNTTTCPEFLGGTVSVIPDLIADMDEKGHGTAMMGITVKTMEQRNDLLEVLSVKVGDNINPASLFGTICGLHLADKENVQVVNLSLGYSGEKSELLEEYIRKLQAKNTVISTSAGNDGVNLDALPANNQYWPAYFVSDPTIQNILTVGSYFEDNGGVKQKSSFSNYSNNYLSLLAPGNNLWSSASSLVSDDLFAPVSGTSGSAALVTGALASVYSGDPGATPAQAISNLFALYSDEVPSLSSFVPSGRILNVNLNQDCIVSNEDKAVNDSVFINSTITSIPVLANDSPDGDPVITIFQQPNYGTATVDANNNVIYELTVQSLGITQDKIVYKLSDESDSCSYAMVVLNIGAVQDTIGTNYYFSICPTDVVSVPINYGDFNEPIVEVYYDGVLATEDADFSFGADTLDIFPGRYGVWNYLLYENQGDSNFVVVRSILIQEDLNCIDSTTSDSLRSTLNPYEAIITKSEEITWEELDSILTNIYGATLIESCLCDGPRLYLLPDTLIDESGVYVGADAVRSRTSTTVAAQTIEFFDKNYNMKNPVLEDTDNTVWDWDVIDLQLGEEKTKVMVIDWGVQKNHPYIQSYISVNPTVCPEFDEGFAAVTPVNDLFADELGHGTAMTGILATTLKQRNDLLEVLVVKLGDDSTEATLFGTICGLHLAEKENVKAVNLSLGYNGEKSALLEDYIKKLQDKNILITTSAGNDGVNLDELPENNQYWPAYLSGNPTIQNLITVGSYFEDSLGNKQKSSFSNYSSQYLSVMAPGNNLFSAASSVLSEDLFAPVSGTSASAAMITGVVASIISREPHATLAAVKEMLFDEYTEEIEELEAFAPGGRALKVSLNIDCILNGTSTAVKDSALMLTYYSNNTQINVLQNDSYTGEPEIQITSQPVYGTAEVLPNNNVLYTTSINNQNFIDQFIYKLTDENSNCSYALVKINSRSVCGVTDIISFTCNEYEVDTQIVYIPKEGGCDSIVNYITQLQNTYYDTIYSYTCNPSNTGITSTIYTSVNDCDSVVTVITELLPSKSSTVEATTCNPAQAGTTYDTLTARNGCDSVVTTITTLIASYDITINLTTCDPSQAGEQTTTYIAATGCDSVVTVITELLPSKSSTLEATTCNPAQVGTTYDTLTASNGCDSVVTTITTLVASYDITINLMTCDPSQAGEETETYTAATGCDSVVTIITELLPSKSSTVEATTCNPAQAGTTYDTLTASNGCDSVVTTITTLLASYNLTINIQSCNPDDVGTVQEILQATSGCDSIITTVTTLKPTYETTLYVETTNPEEVGVESQIYTAVNGCDSLVTIVTTLISEEQPYAILDYLTLFQTGIDQYWTLNSDGIARIEVRQDPVFSLTGKKKIVIDSPDKIPGTAYADLHINLKSGTSKNIHLFFWWKRYDGKYNDDVGVYYVDKNTNTSLLITKYKGNKDLIGFPFSINLTKWATKNGIELSDKSVIRFVYKTDKKVPNNIFQGGGGFALDMVYVHQNTNSINLKQQVLSIAETAAHTEEIARRMDAGYEDEIIDNENPDMKVYPNPVVAGNQLIVELNTRLDKPIVIEIYSLEGRLIDLFIPESGSVTGNIITIETQKVTQSGTYFIHVIEDGIRTVKKVQIVTAY